MNTLTVKPVDFTTVPWLTKAIDEDESFFMMCQLTQYDREGFELLPIEQKYYEASGFNLHNEDVYAHESGQGKKGWKAVVAPWIVQVQKHPNIFLDHSFCTIRCGYAGQAFEQLKYFAGDRIELMKILHTRPKYGLDFCIDWIDEDGVIELIHIEWDFQYNTAFNRHKQKLEKDIMNTDWESVAKTLKSKKSEWQRLSADEQGKYKAKILNLNTEAFHLLKSI